MSWYLNAQLIESCSCTMLCPCWFGPAELMVMDQGWCASPLLFRIEEGDAAGVDLAGQTVVVAADFPGPTLYDGNGTARVYIDEKSTEAQRKALESIFQGKWGGPMSILGGLMSTWLSSQYLPIEIHEEGDTTTATVGTVGRIESSLLKSEAGEQMHLQNAGFTVAFQFENQTGELAPSRSHWRDPDMPRTYETHSGVQGRFHWQGE